MRKLLGTLVLIVLIIAGFGFFRGWFSVSTEEQPGETNVQLKIDKERIKEDAEQAQKTAREFGNKDGEPAN